jgi:hypothetical protein
MYPRQNKNAHWQTTPKILATQSKGDTTTVCVCVCVCVWVGARACVSAHELNFTFN